MGRGGRSDGGKYVRTLELLVARYIVRGIMMVEGEVEL